MLFSLSRLLVREKIKDTIVYTTYLAAASKAAMLLALNPVDTVYAFSIVFIQAFVLQSL